MTSTDRISREKEFHNEVYESKARRRLSSLYTPTHPIRVRYKSLLFEHCSGKRMLEYGCGLGSYSFSLASQGASVTGIDISEFAIEEARREAEAKNLQIDFKVMNAEQLGFPDGSFDVICGTGILHHLNISDAVREIRRVLSPAGKAIFIEPLGHNPMVNLFRAMTPKLRSEDEHPLRANDLKVLSESFMRCHFEYYYLLSLAALPLGRLPFSQVLMKLLDRTDKSLFSALPFLQQYAWQVLIILEK